jgi:phage terminase large subunit-like protein
MHITLNDDYYDRACVSQPPRTAKSSLITLSYPFWLILNDPNKNIVIVNNTQTLAENFGIRLRQLFIDYKDLLEWNNIRLSDTKHSNSFFMFEDLDGRLYDGSIKLMGTGGTITGQNVDILICDDLVKGFSDVTPTLLDKKIEWFKSIILQRLEPHSKLIILGTRWASNDVIGYLQENQPNDYKFINLTALNEDESDCIWNNRYTPEFFEERRLEVGDRVFEAQYQGQPLDETGDFFNIDKLRFIDSNELRDYVITSTVRSYDCAYSDETKGEVNDRTASILMSRTIDDYYIIKDLSVGRYGENLFNVIKSTARIDTPNIPILVETGTAGGSAKALFDVYHDRLSSFNIKQSKPITSKVDRAYGFKEAILDGKVLVCLGDESRAELLKEMKGFPLMKRDDIIDSCSYAFNYLSEQGNVSVGTAGKRRRARI